MKVETSGALAETALPDNSDVTRFSIKASPKLMWLMIDSLYSDKPKALLREFSINAWEVSNGKPIKVHLPTALDSTLRITDFGPGLSEPDIRRLFTTMGESTKDQDNTNIGGFGIGCKSWAAYATQITVRSRIHNEETTYQLYRDGDDLFLTKLGVVACSEPSGLTIEIPVKTSDQYLFRNAAATVFRHFDPQPEGIKIEAPQYVFKGNLYSLRESSYYNQITPYVVMGMIEYPLDKNVLRPHLQDNEGAVLDFPIELRFKIGDLNIAPSREALSYDKSTVQRIAARLLMVSKLMAEDAVRDINSRPTGWEKRLALHDWARRTPGLSKLLKGRTDLEVETSTVAVSYPVTSDIQVAYVPGSELKRTRFAVPWDYYEDFSVTPQTKVVWVDNQHRLRDRLREAYLEDKNPLILIKCPSEQIPQVLNDLGNPPCVKVSDLPLPPVDTLAASPRRSSKTRKVLRLSSYGEWEETSLDVSQGGVYIHRENGNLSCGYQKLPSLTERDLNGIKSWAHKISGESLEIYAFNKSGWGIPEKNPKWITLSSWLEQTVKKHKKKIEKIMSSASVNSHARIWGSKINFLREINNQDIQKLVSELEQWEELTNSYEVTRTILESYLRESSIYPSYRFDFAKLNQKIMDKHPLAYRLIHEVAERVLNAPTSPTRIALLNYFNGRN